MVSVAIPLLFNKTTGTSRLSSRPLLAVGFLSICGSLLSNLFPLFVRFWRLKRPFLLLSNLFCLAVLCVATSAILLSSSGTRLSSCLLARLTPAFLPAPRFLSRPVGTCFFSRLVTSMPCFAEFCCRILLLAQAFVFRLAGTWLLTPDWTWLLTDAASLMTCLVEFAPQAPVLRFGQAALVERLTWRELLFRAAFASASSFNRLACRANSHSILGKYFR